MVETISSDFGTCYQICSVLKYRLATGKHANWGSCNG